MASNPSNLYCSNKFINQILIPIPAATRDGFYLRGTQSGYEGHPASHSMGSGSSLLGGNAAVSILTTHLLLVWRLRMIGVQDTSNHATNILNVDTYTNVLSNLTLIALPSEKVPANFVTD